MAEVEEKVTISKKRYEQLLKAEAWLNCLEQAGIDNWSGIEVAHDIMEEEGN